VDDPISHLPGYALRRASNAMMAAFARALEPTGLRASEATALTLIKANPGIAQSRLCAALDIQSANMTPMLTRLEQRELVERKPVNGRTNGLYLTGKGASVANLVHTIIDAHEAALVARIPDQHRAHLLPALRALRD
jgi:DNA-binding MarR family transcriptional regulator